MKSQSWGYGLILAAAIFTAMFLLPGSPENDQGVESDGNPTSTAADRDDETSDNSFKPASKQNDWERKVTLESVKKIDDHPLYFMKYTGDYEIDPMHLSALPPPRDRAWACSIFYTIADKEHPLYGRNFDWNDQPVVVLFTDPPNRYASVSMVDVSYLGYGMEELKKFDDVESRKDLVEATQIPFDGMNEHGLTIGMAAVGDTEVVDDPKRPNAQSLQIIRLALDTAKTTCEAIKVFKKYDIEFSGGPIIHYLIADPSGHSVLIEVKDGKVNLIENRGTGQQATCWQTATNFYMTGQDHPERQCWRYNKIQKRLSADRGVKTVDQAMRLLKDVAQGSTRWSVVYEMSEPAINIVMSRKYGKDAHRFSFSDVYETSDAK